MKNVVTLIAFVCIIFAGNDARASHAAGADLFYKSLGNNRYEITYNLYRDCMGIPVSPSYSVDVTSASNGTTFTVLLNLDSLIRPQGIANGSDISPVCASAVNNTTCAQPPGNYPGVQHYQYTAIVTLPSRSRDWVISYSECCRNAAITNLVSPDSYELYIYATINNLDVLEVNSPVLSNRPIAMYYSGTEVLFDHGAYDADGDSLVFSLVNPLTNNGTQITAYSGILSPTQPMTSIGPFQFDTRTGQMRFTPNGPQVIVIAVLVQAYRNGILVSTIMRDMQAQVLNGTSISAPVALQPVDTATITGGISVGNNAITTCVGNTLSFSISAVGESAQVTSTISGFNPAVLFSTTTYPSSQIGMDSVVGTFSWTPTVADTGVNLFSIAYTDNACPLRHVGSQGISVRVLNAVDVGPDLNYCPGGVPVQLNANLHTSATWSPSTGLSHPNSTVTNASPSTTTTYIVTANLPAGCRNIDTVTVSVVSTFPLSVAPAIDINLCQVQQDTLIVTPALGQGPYTYRWFPSLGLSDTASSIAVASPSTSTVYYVDVTAANGCVVRDSFVVNNVANSSILASHTGVCAGDTIHLNAGLPASLSNVTYSWSPSAGLSTSTTANTVATVNSPVTYTLTYSSPSCSGTKTIDLTADSLHLTVTGDTTLCARDTVQLHVAVSGVIRANGTCGAAGQQCYGNSFFTNVGTDTAMSPTTSIQPSMYGSYYGSRKTQIIYPASELQAAGLTKGMIKNIAFNVASIPVAASNVFKDFSIRMICVPNNVSSALAFLPNTAMVDVFTTKDIQIQTGWNTHDFDTYYNWDGQSSILVEICFNNASAGNANVRTYCSQTSYTSINGYSIDFISACAQGAPNSFDSMRPNTRFEVCDGGSYQIAWAPSAGMANPAAADQYVTPRTSTVYKVDVTTGACYFKDSVIVQMNLLNIANTQSLPDSCLRSVGALEVNASNGTAPYTFKWFGGPTNSTAGTENRTQLIAGNYRLTVTDDNGCNNDTVLTVALICDSVWPGDANYDGVADVNDVLQIAVAYGSTGPTRPNATLTWAPQYCNEWQSFVGGINDKHMDCNGNGIIDVDDTLAVSQNYSFTHQKAEGPQATPNDPTVMFVPTSDTILAGDLLYLDIMAGTQAIPVDSLYGLACSMLFDSDIFDPRYIQLSGDNSWLGTTGNNMFTFRNGWPINGKIDMAITRFNHADATGYGKVGQLILKTKAQLPNGAGIETVTITPSVVKGITSTSNEHAYNVGTSKVTIIDSLTGILETNVAQSIHLYPNPSNGKFVFSMQQATKKLKIELLNMQGQILYTEQISNQSSFKRELDFTTHAKGIYLLKVSTENGVGVKRVVIE